MTSQQEHEVKVAFISNMPNKYDYLSFKEFCISNSFEVMTFLQYASYIDGEDKPHKPNPLVFEESRGLGDTVAKITHATGLDKLAQLYTQVTGKPCGCTSRQEALNKLVPYGIKEDNI